MGNPVEYWKIFIYQYLPQRLIPNNMEDMSFDDFFRLCAKAEIARDMFRDDLITGVNKGYVYAHPDADIE